MYADILKGKYVEYEVMKTTMNTPFTQVVQVIENMYLQL